MIMFIPVRNVDLTGLPDWFVRIYVVVYGLAFAAMVGAMAYAMWLMYAT
jgi:hypothetical protein